MNPVILEIRKEYTDHLVDILTPYIYEGLASVYKEAMQLSKDVNCSEKLLLIFQKKLQAIIKWDDAKINEETTRIKRLSNTADYLDDLVKAIIKTDILLLTNTNDISGAVAENFYDSFTTSALIHRCYIECGKDVHNNPYLFFHDVDVMDYKRNQLIIQQQIRDAIVRAIRNVLPIQPILKQYNSDRLTNELSAGYYSAPFNRIVAGFSQWLSTYSLCAAFEC